MPMRRSLLTALLCLVLSPLTFGAGPTEGQPLPPLAIAERGEVILKGDEFSFQPWSSEHDPGKVHILQYFGGTLRDRDLFSPFTDLLQEELDYTKYHVTTIINLDVALWGTTGFVVSEIKDSKRQYPRATMVLDEDGIGVRDWQLGKRGAVLAVMDNQGTVRIVSSESLDSEQMQQALEFVRGQIAEAEALASAAE